MLYLRTTVDRYELPVAVAESPRELAEMLHTTANVVSSSITHKRPGWFRVEEEPDMWADNDGRLWYYGPNSEVIYVD